VTENSILPLNSPNKLDQFQPHLLWNLPRARTSRFVK